MGAFLSSDVLISSSIFFTIAGWATSRCLIKPDVHFMWWLQVFPLRCLTRHSTFLSLIDGENLLTNCQHQDVNILLPIWGSTSVTLTVFPRPASTAVSVSRGDCSSGSPATTDDSLAVISTESIPSTESPKAGAVDKKADPDSTLLVALGFRSTGPHTLGSSRCVWAGGPYHSKFQREKDVLPKRNTTEPKDFSE